MVNEVDKLIYNTLIEQGSVTLPGIGTLRLERKPATAKDKSTLVAPSFSVLYASREDATSIIDVIHNIADTTQEAAEDIYARWQDKVRDDNRVIITTVGVLRDKSFHADESFLATINPFVESVKISRKRSLKWLWITLGILLIAGAATATYLIMNKANSKSDKEVSGVVDNSGVVIEIEEITTIQETTTEPSTTEVAATDNNTIEASVETSIEEVITKPVEVIEEEKPAVWSDAGNVAHYVIVGTYSSQQNVDYAIDDIAKNTPDIACVSLKYGKMYVVAAFGSNDIAECQAFMRTHRKQFSQTWIYSPRQRK